MFKRFLLLALAILLPVQGFAQVTWAWRSSDAAGQAYHANAWKAVKRIKTSTTIPLTTTAISGVFGGQYLDVSTSSPPVQLAAPGLHNTPIGTSAITVLFRLIPRNSGNPAARKSLMYLGNLASRTDGWNGGLGFNIDSGGQFEVDGGTVTNGTNWGNNKDLGALTFVANQPTDVWFVWDGSTTANAMKLYQAQNGNTAALVGTGTASAARPSMELGWVTEIQVGNNLPMGNGYNDAFHVNEIVIWDTAEDPTAYGARSTWITAAGTEGYSFTDPGVANVRSTTSYTYAGASQTGTLVVPATSDVKTGVTFGAASALTGTYTGSDRWTCPLAGQLSNGVQLKCNSTSLNLTGTLDSVTNVLSSQTMTGSSTSGVLVAQ